MELNIELYNGKSFQDLCKDIVQNQSDRKEQIDIFISDLRPLIKTANDALQIIPLIKQYLDAGISNDEALVKLAQICQRLMIAQSAAEADGATGLLTEEDKKQLMESLDNIKTSSVPVIPMTKIDKKDD